MVQDRAALAVSRSGKLCKTTPRPFIDRSLCSFSEACTSPNRPWTRWAASMAALIPDESVNVNPGLQKSGPGPWLASASGPALFPPWRSSPPGRASPKGQPHWTRRGFGFRFPVGPACLLAAPQLVRASPSRVLGLTEIPTLHPALFRPMTRHGARGRFSSLC